MKNWYLICKGFLRVKKIQITQCRNGKSYIPEIHGETGFNCKGNQGNANENYSEVLLHTYYIGKNLNVWPPHWVGII